MASAAAAYPKKLKDSSPAAARAARISAGGLLLLEQKTRKDIRQIVDDATKRAAGEASVRTQQLERAALAALILHASRRMATDVAEAIRRGRERARIAAANRLRVELRAAGAEATAVRIRLAATVTHVDEVHALSSAEALAAAWRTRTLHAAVRADQQDKSTSEAIGGTSIDGSVGRTAATETAQAYNDGRQDAAESLGPYRSPGEATDDALLDDPGIILLDKWDAMLDARVCPACRALDGTLTLLGQPFESGEEPGYIHVLCRCIRTAVTLPRH